MPIAGSETPHEAVRNGGAAGAGSQTHIRAMVVDDSIVVRSLVRRWLTEEPGIEIVAAHRTGADALREVARAAPDVIILDIEMPDMDGLTALPQLLKLCPGVSVIMASTLTRRNAEISIRCLSLGAADYLPKPEVSRDINGTMDFKRDLIAKVRALGERRLRARVPGYQSPVVEQPAGVPLLSRGKGPFQLRPFTSARARVLAIGSSTGGPQALVEVFKNFKGRRFSVPIFVTQHMPPSFTAVLAEHLARASEMPAQEGASGMTAQPGHIYVAPGGYHMRVGGSSLSPKIQLDDGPAINFCRPAVDPMFESLVSVYGREILAVVLTGMGHDGAKGGLAIADAGGNVIIQDEATSVVWGMPGTTAQTGACAAVLPLKDIGPRIVSLVTGAGT